jgi:hypothetical protein
MWIFNVKNSSTDADDYINGFYLISSKHDEYCLPNYEAKQNYIFIVK